MLKCENTQYKVENSIQSNAGTVSASLNILSVESSGCRAFQDTAEKEELINLLLTIL